MSTRPKRKATKKQLANLKRGRAIRRANLKKVHLLSLSFFKCFTNWKLEEKKTKKNTTQKIKTQKKNYGKKKKNK